MTDIVKLLRNLAEFETATSKDDVSEHIAWIAADEIERLRDALEQSCRRGCDYCADDVRNARASLNAKGEANGKWLRVPADDDVETVLTDQIGRLPDDAIARLIRGALGRDGVVEDLATRFRSDDWLGREVASSIRTVIRWTIPEEKPHD